MALTSTNANKKRRNPRRRYGICARRNHLIYPVT
jgi:hypothetical protein